MHRAQYTSALYRETTLRLYEAGFNVIGVCCDGSQANRSWWKHEFTQHWCDDPLSTFALHPVTHEPVFWVSDPSHVAKKVCNSVESSGLAVSRAHMPTVPYASPANGLPPHTAGRLESTQDPRARQMVPGKY